MKDELIFTSLKVIQEKSGIKVVSNQNTETLLRRNEKHFKELIHNFEDFSWEMDESGVFIYVDEKLEKLLEYHPNEIIGKKYLDFMGSNSEQTRNNSTTALDQKEPILGFELKIRLRNNREIWLLINGVPFYDEEKIFRGYRGIAKDITASKTEHEKLVWNSNILKLLSENSLMGLYFVDDRNDKILFYNRKFCELWGIENLEEQITEGLIRHEELMSIISTKVKDTNHFRQSINISEESISKLKFENEYLLSNNRIIYNYSTEINSDGGIHIGRVYIFKDISAPKIYASLKRDEKEYHNLIEHAPDAIIITDLETNILFVNSATKKLFGYSETELLKMKAVDIIEPTNLFLNPIKFEELNTGKTLLVERILLNNRGVKINAEVRAKKIQGNKIFTIIRDLAERNQSIKEHRFALKSEILKKLYIKLKSFKHGEDSTMVLNRISLLTKNIKNIWSSSDTSPDTMKNETNKKIENLSRAKSLAGEYILLCYPQLKQIVSLIETVEIESSDFKILGFSKTNSNDLRKASEFLKICFDKFSESTLVKIEVPEQYRNGREIIENVKTIKKSLEKISKLFENYFLSDFREEIYIIINKYRQLCGDISIGLSDFSNKTVIILNNDELKEILTILFSNSIEALSISDVKNKKINITLKDTESKLIIEFENNGVNFDENIRKKLFTERISTKGEKRGFGLFYARKCLRKYGGDIYLDESYKKGTKFVFELTPI